MKTILTPCNVLRFYNNKIVVNMLVEEPPCRGVEAFTNDVSCCDWFAWISVSLGAISKGSPSDGVGFSFSYCCN
jgi:hypothetical protein